MTLRETNPYLRDPRKAAASIYRSVQTSSAIEGIKMPDRYLKQVIVVRKDLSMPTGKLAAIVAHAAMTFIVKRMNSSWVQEREGGAYDGHWFPCAAYFTPDEYQWLTEPEPGIYGQISFAKIVCAVDSYDELFDLEGKALRHGLTVHRVVDGGYSHNKKGDVPAIAIGPAWPEQLEPVTGQLKVYR